MEFDDKLRMKCSQWQCLNTSPVQVWLSEGKLVPERFRGNTGDNDDNDSHRYKYHYCVSCPGLACLGSSVFIGLSVSYTYMDN